MISILPILVSSKNKNLRIHIVLSGQLDLRGQNQGLHLSATSDTGCQQADALSTSRQCSKLKEKKSATHCIIC